MRNPSPPLRPPRLPRFLRQLAQQKQGSHKQIARVKLSLKEPPVPLRVQLQLTLL